MKSELKLILGAFTTLAIAACAMVFWPYIQVARLKAPPGLKPYTDQQLRGREVYISEGCLYCHSQQPGDPSYVRDQQRGWGRPSIPADYVYDKPPLLGTMRTGPDLFNIGARQPSADWNLGHLYQPRAYVPGSIMPSFRFLFEIKAQAQAGDQVIQVPPAYAPAKGVVVARPEAIDLVAYLLSLDHTYSALPDAVP